MATKAAIYFINGTVTINGSDAATISAVESSVLLTVKQDQKEFAGSRIASIESHTTKVEAMLKITKPIFKKEILDNLLGMSEGAGVLKDGATVSTNYNMTLNNYFQRPEISILISGKDDKTGKKIEIEAAKAVLMNDLELLLSKDEFAQPDLELLILGNDDSPDAALFEVRFED